MEFIIARGLGEGINVKDARNPRNIHIVGMEVYKALIKFF